jgi:hypothetical protein
MIERPMSSLQNGVTVPSFVPTTKPYRVLLSIGASK